MLILVIIRVIVAVLCVPFDIVRIAVRVRDGIRAVNLVRCRRGDGDSTLSDEQNINGLRSLGERYLALVSFVILHAADFKRIVRGDRVAQERTRGNGNWLRNLGVRRRFPNNCAFIGDILSAVTRDGQQRYRSSDTVDRPDGIDGSDDVICCFADCSAGVVERKLVRTRAETLHSVFLKSDGIVLCGVVGALGEGCAVIEQ